MDVRDQARSDVEPVGGDVDKASPAAGYRFRALTTNGKRRGLRLEAQFWSVLETIASEEERRLSDIVGDLAENSPDAINIASLLRVYALTRTSQQLWEMRARTGRENIDRLVQACPSPAFLLSEKKRLYAFNTAFVRFVSRSFARENLESLGRELRLNLDQNTDVLVKRLREGDNAFVQVGFAVGMDDRRVRGTINAVLAPAWKETLMICYVVD